MRIWKRLACLALPAAVCLTLLAGCAGEADGVSLSVCVGSAPVTLDPIYAEETGDQTILAHLYENLMRVAVDVSGTPTVTGGMAKDVDRGDLRRHGDLHVPPPQRQVVRRGERQSR